MFLPNPIACDVCGILKQPSNHWYYAMLNVSGPCFTILPWHEIAEDRARADVVHLCGQACADKKLAEWMNPKPETDKLDTHDNAPE